MLERAGFLKNRKKKFVAKSRFEDHENKACLSLELFLRLQNPPAFARPTYLEAVDKWQLRPQLSPQA